MAKNDEGSIALDKLLPAIDRKDYNWWSTLTAEQQEGFSSWLYMRYASSVQHSDPDFPRYYLQSVNQHVNKHFNIIRRHPQLVYLLLCAASPGIGTQRHNFLPPGKKGKANKRNALFAKLYPLCNEEELDILAQVNTDEDLREYMLDAGWTDKEIAAALKE